MDTTTFHHIEYNDTKVAKNDLKVIVIFPAKNEEVRSKIQFRQHQEVVLIQR